MLIFKTSFIIRSSKNLLLLIDLTKSDEIGVDSNANYKDEIVKKLLLMPENLNGVINYLKTNA